MIKKGQDHTGYFNIFCSGYNMESNMIFKTVLFKISRIKRDLLTRHDKPMVT